MTTLVLEPQSVPLREDETGSIRVGATRVPLELVVEAYLDGATPETIVQWFDSLRLADVYAVISYYLNHQEAVHHYLRQREAFAAEVRRKIEAFQPSRPNFREELLARRAQREGRNASAGQ
jgi:uncharacterized protein (DUF433 family)